MLRAWLCDVLLIQHSLKSRSENLDAIDINQNSLGCFMSARGSQVIEYLSAAGRVSELELDDDASMTHEIMAKIERGKQMGISPYVALLKTLRRSLKHLPLFDDERS